MYCQTEQTEQRDQREQARGSALPESGTLGWNDEIEQDGEEYVLLPEGDYCFTVTGVERARFPGNSKTEPCNKMIVTLEVDSEEGRALMKEWGVPDNYICQGFVILGYIDGDQPVSKPRKPGRVQIIE